MASLLDSLQQEPESRAKQLADAFALVAQCNHYMVGIVETITDDELCDAYQILIDRDNSQDNQNQQIDFALYLVEQEKQKRRLP